MPAGRLVTEVDAGLQEVGEGRRFRHR
jgi:hypothetical protein